MMKLRDQFEDIIQATLDTKYPDQAIENNPPKCVEVAEEFTLSFVKWVDKNYYQGENYDSYARAKEDFGTEDYAIEQLLEIYKKEKGL